MSGKYDGQEVIGDYKRVVILTNEPLNWNAMSLDRWKILHLKDGKHTWHTYTSWMMVGGGTGIEGIRNSNHFEDKKSSTPPLTTTPNYSPATSDVDKFCPDDCYMAHVHNFRSLQSAMDEFSFN